MCSITSVFAVKIIQRCETEAVIGAKLLGPKPGAVTAVVTLDGEPLGNAGVSFHPESGKVY